ncbi:hypothetical protein NDN08_001505 [Rhodosorus marinus]|uniref:CMP/dCMP-type deaminase domain-containing protein n=1 Tax=Rhodosorus marinus TaxID=101924 RepID=A0AAV8UTT5_9RHOD|nr:hypothetical protein NDN08_001505 [Rhodosorus marinus]
MYLLAGFAASLGSSVGGDGNGHTALDRRMMRRCVELAKRAAGKTRPNPVVGCVVVNDEGLVVGEGFHEKAGGPHAEVVALKYAGIHSAGAKVYVSLEPCNHFGRTPPCVDALLNAGVGEVFVGMVDPDPRTAGKGVDRLKENGVKVRVGIEEELCQSANEGFSYRIRNKVPLGTWKYAMTLDGKIASDTGSSKWVSGEAARSIVQRVRSESDAIIVGGNTVRVDNPRLTVREYRSDGLQPIRVVMTSTMDLPKNARLWDVSDARTIVFTRVSAAESKPELYDHLLKCGVEVMLREEICPRFVMEHLYGEGAMNVLWECGGKLAAEAMRNGCIQNVIAFLAPKLIGGMEHSPLSNFGLQDMSKALNVCNVRFEQVGKDFVFYGRVENTG